MDNAKADGLVLSYMVLGELRTIAGQVLAQKLDFTN